MKLEKWILSDEPKYQLCCLEDEQTVEYTFDHGLAEGWPFPKRLGSNLNQKDLTTKQVFLINFIVKWNKNDMIYT